MQAHSAPLNIAFYDRKDFPADTGLVESSRATLSDDRAPKNSY